MDKTPTDAGGSVAAAWRARAGELADWTLRRLVNRDDVWGAYRDPGEVGKEYRARDGSVCKLGATYTAPKQRQRGLLTLTRRGVELHFCAELRGDIKGLHALSRDGRCKWVGIDIDAHDGGAGDPDRNRRAALRWYAVLTGLGFCCLLYTSNGKGGYHLVVLFCTPVPGEVAFWFVRWATRDHKGLGFPDRPEVFPKQQRLTGKTRFGNWLRVVGKHHTRDHWAEVWDGSSWLTGEAAVAHLLGLPGASPGLIPDVGLMRAEMYMAEVGNLAEGEGRNNLAYRLWAKLTRDLALQDPDAWPFMLRWDAGNVPPLGEEELRRTLANAHQYGRNAYGSALDGRRQQAAPDDAPPAGPPEPPHPTAGPQTSCQTILGYWRESYNPLYRTTDAVYSSTLGRLVRRTEALGGADSVLIARLAAAADAPVTKDGDLVEQQLPSRFKTWAPTAWADLVRSLPLEEQSEEFDANSAEAFRRELAEALYQIESLGYVRKGKNDGDKDSVTEVERRALIDWCGRFARGGRWERVRGFLLWCRTEVRGDQVQLCLAVRVELFAQLKRPNLQRVSATHFTLLCERYGYGKAAKVQGQRCVFLDDSFVNDLLAAPPEHTEGADAGEGPSA